jgi:hypothetical protein
MAEEMSACDDLTGDSTRDGSVSVNPSVAEAVGGEAGRSGMGVRVIGVVGDDVSCDATISGAGDGAKTSSGTESD